MGLFDKFKKKEEKNFEVPEEWIKRGAKTQQEVIDYINEAYDDKENLAYNIYIGKTKIGNICILIDDNKKIINAFPTNSNKETYLKVINKIKESILDKSNNIQIGRSGDTNVCFVLDNKGRLIESFPISKEQEVYFTTSSTVNMGILNSTNVEFFSLAITIDYLNNLVLFYDKKEIATYTSLFKTRFWRNNELGFIIGIDIGPGEIVIGYDYVKSIIDEIK